MRNESFAYQDDIKQSWKQKQNVLSISNKVDKTDVSCLHFHKLFYHCINKIYFSQIYRVTNRTFI